MSELMGNTGFLATVTEQPGDIKLPLQSLLVRRPTEPIYLNNSPYQCFIDEEGSQSLIEAVNLIRRERPAPGELEPQLLEITSGEPAVPFYDYAARAARVRLPQAVYQPESLPDELAQQLETALSRDILQAIHQAGTLKTAVQERKDDERSVPLGGMSGALLAEAVYFLSDTPQTAFDIVGVGTLGYMVGTTVATGAIWAKEQWQKQHTGSHAATLVKRAVDLAITTEPEPTLVAQFVKPPILLLPAPPQKPLLWTHRELKDI